jgi:Glycosyl transferase family 2
MSRVTVITVTFNNAAGLRATLGSLAGLRFRPGEVVVVDGGSRDGTESVVRDFEAQLPLSYTSEPDKGIYDAMNKGLSRARGDLLHYLNGGDTVYGEPYQSLPGPARLPVRITDESGKLLFNDFVKYGGYGYCHQGLLLPAGHAPYRTQFKIGADLDVIVATFPDGVAALPLVGSGGVTFAVGGVSSHTRWLSTREALRIFGERLPWYRAARLQALLIAKSLVPRAVRRALVGAAEHTVVGDRPDKPG